MSNCKECGHPTQFSRDIGSAVCTHCGTLADSSQQSALTSASDFLPDAYTHDLNTSTCATTLKSIRRNAVWDLPGQASDSRNERNKFVLYESIQTLADRLGHRGAAIRAKAIFDSMMQRPTLRWGRAAKLAAGAALVFAIREQDRGDYTHHIAYILSEPIVELKRTQLRLLPHLALALPRNRATSHLHTLAAHLNAIASASVTNLPKDTLAFVRPLLSHIAVQDVLRTASALYDLPNLERSTFNAGSAGAGGCALLLLALEAHARPPRPMPHALVLASQLGAALGERGTAVMARYRVLVNIVEAGAARVPWLANANSPGSKHIARRSRVASAVLDVLQFREGVLQAEIAEGGGPIHIDLEGVDDGDDEEGGDVGRNETGLDALFSEVEQKATNNTRIMALGPGACVMARTTVAPERKPKKRRTATFQAAGFLLDPLANIAPASTALTHTSYLLSSDAGVRSDVPPTRLQLLAAERGETDAVRDDELFGEGELEEIMIGTDEKARGEREKRAQAMRIIWGEEVANSTRDDADTERGKSRYPRRHESYKTKKGRERIDMGKLTALFDSDDQFVALGVEELCPGDEDKEGGEAGRGSYIEGAGGEEVEGEWRPVSPGGFEVEWPGEW